MGDCFACTEPFLVHDLVLSSRSFAVTMTNLADSEVRRNKLVSYFFNVVRLPVDQSPGLIKVGSAAPVWNMGSFQLDGIPSREYNVGLIVTPWLWPCTSFLFHPHNTPLWVCQKNDRVHQSTFLCPNSGFAEHLARLSKHDPIVLLRQLHDKLHFEEFLGKCLEMLSNSQPFLCCAFAGINFQTR